ncbi:MAG TPA: MFS transporter [Rhizomicrobium sp.]|nr:MFS transporter [Rhizomicrobium sp.]
MPLAGRQLLIPLMVACALFMENLDSTVINTALPAIARSLHENPLTLNMGITSYLFSLAVFVPISGWVADRFGARVVFQAAIIIFTLGSISCAFSQSLSDFVLARIFQGMGGAMMVPVGRLVILRNVSKAELVEAMAYVTIPALVGPIVGPPLGGFITTYFDWRWIFWINVPIGIVGVFLAQRLIRNIKEDALPPLDWRGLIMTGVGCSGLIFGFEFLGRGAVPASVAFSLILIGGAASALYVWHARRVAHPLLNLSLLEIPTFRASVTGGFLFRMGVGATPFLLPLMLQVGFGFSPLHSGLLTFVAAAGALVMKFTAPQILRRFGFRPVLVWNSLICGGMLACYALIRADTPALFVWLLLLTSGFFRSLLFTSLNAVAYADMPPERMSQATSFSSMGQQLSLSFGVGFGALVLHLASLRQGGAKLVPEDFVVAFVSVALISTFAVFSFRALPEDAGSELTGARAVRVPSGKEAAQPGA